MLLRRQSVVMFRHPAPQPAAPGPAPGAVTFGGNMTIRDLWRIQ
jgi:hypothetical protein